MLDEHLWAFVLQHLDTLQDHVKAATSCRAAWKAGLLKLDIPVYLPTEGMNWSTLQFLRALCILYITRTGSVLTSIW